MTSIMWNNLAGLGACVVILFLWITFILDTFISKIPNWMSNLAVAFSIMIMIGGFGTAIFILIKILMNFGSKVVLS